jgi:hypothetical protein
VIVVVFGYRPPMTGAFELGVGNLKMVISEPWPSERPAEYVVVNLRAVGLNAGDQIAVDPAWSPALFLSELGAAWSGWSGRREWESPGGNLTLIAWHDGVGRVNIRATLGTFHAAKPTIDGEWQATGVVEFEPGSLSRLADELALFLRHR